MGDFVAGEIPLLSSFLYLLGDAERVRRSLTSGGCHGVLEPSAQSGVPVPTPASSGVPFARFVRSASGSVVVPVADLPSCVIRFEDTARRGV